MTRHRATVFIRVSWFLLALGSVQAAKTAELRTTAVGSPVARQVSYQTLEEPFGEEPFGVSALESIEQVSGHKAYPPDDVWMDEGDGAYCGPSQGGCGYWGGLEFLLWWRPGQDVPALLTSSPDGTPIEDAGVLDTAGTQVLYGQQTLGDDANPGGRLTLGKWLDSCQILGVGTRLYAVGENTANYQATSDQFPILARPFFNATSNQLDSNVLAFPGSSTGTVAISNTSRIGGGDVYFRRLFYSDSCRRVDLVAGYQFARINQDLTVTAGRTSIDPQGSIPVGTLFETEDLFATKNEYHAGEIGFLAEYDRGPWTWSVLAKVGLGKMRQRVRIAGQTHVTIPGQPTSTTDQGMLALDTNTGSYSQSVFAVSPEVGFHAAYHLNETMDLTVGYSFIHWNRMVQPADQVDTTLNLSQIAGDLDGAARPAFEFNDSDYFVQGLNFGVSWIY